MMPETRMAVIAISFAAGILAAAYMPVMVWLAVAVGAVAFAMGFMTGPKRAVICVTAVVFALGGARYANSREVPSDDVSRIGTRVFEFRGLVASDPETTADRVRVTCRVDSVKIGGRWKRASGRVLVNLYQNNDSPPPRLEYGDRIRVAAPAYPPRDPTNPGQFSWKDYLARQGIYSCAYVRSSDQVEVLAGNRGNALVRAALAAKDWIAGSIERISPKREASVIIGMVLGTYSYLPAETFKNFGRTGTLHLLAASGYNCFILLFLATPVLKLMRVTPKWRSCIILGLLFMYLLMVGAKPSLLRASIMSSLWLIGPLLRRVPNTRNLFFTAGLIVLAMGPEYLFDVGFQLSFLAVWALIYSAPIIEAALQAARPVKQDRKIKTGVLRVVGRFVSREAAAAGVATVTVTLFTAPVVACCFNYFSLVSIPANMALAIGVPVIFAVGIAAPVAAMLGPVGTAIGWIGGVVTHAMLGIVNYLGAWEHASVPVASPGSLAILGYYLMLYSALCYARSKFVKR
ncbi:MAG: ComEC/Rec2 family competence protein [Armatimonadota bacterium]|nr:ComEC family competence protein [bacterium]